MMATSRVGAKFGKRGRGGRGAGEWDSKNLAMRSEEGSFRDATRTLKALGESRRGADLEWNGGGYNEPVRDENRDNATYGDSRAGASGAQGGSARAVAEDVT